MATYDVDETRAKVNELVERSLTGEKITISTDAGNVVMVSEEDWDDLVEALSMMMLPEVMGKLMMRYSKGLQ